jgi:hypothetical protein
MRLKNIRVRVRVRACACACVRVRTVCFESRSCSSTSWTLARICVDSRSTFLCSCCTLSFSVRTWVSSCSFCSTSWHLSSCLLRWHGTVRRWTNTDNNQHTRWTVVRRWTNIDNNQHTRWTVLWCVPSIAQTQTPWGHDGCMPPCVTGASREERSSAAKSRSTRDGDTGSICSPGNQVGGEAVDASYDRARTNVLCLGDATPHGNRAPSLPLSTQAEQPQAACLCR